MGRMLDAIRSKVEGDYWKYKGVTNKFMGRHTFVHRKRGEELNLYFMNGAGSHAGYVVKVEGARKDATLVLTNGFVSKRGALILADMYMSDDRPSPAAFMGGKRQDEWLRENAGDYEYDVIDERVVMEILGR